MGIDDLFNATQVSASGLAAERLRMEVLANNIANANSTRSADGGAFRRQEVVFASVLNDRLAGDIPGREQLGGVRVVGIENDPSELHRVHNPGHPDADKDGYVELPNVALPIEMVNLITASRAYEANLRVMQSFRQISEQALSILRG